MDVERLWRLAPPLFSRCCLSLHSRRLLSANTPVCEQHFAGMLIARDLKQFLPKLDSIPKACVVGHLEYRVSGE